MLTEFTAQFRTIPGGRSFNQVWTARAGPLRPSFRRVGLHGVRVRFHVCGSLRHLFARFFSSCSSPPNPLPVSSHLIAAIILPPVVKPTSKCTPLCCYPTYLNVFCIIYLFSCSSPSTPSLLSPLPIGLHTGSSSPSVAYIYHRLRHR